MNNSSFKIAFELKVSHDYFQDSINGIHIYPGHFSKELMQRFNILINKIKGTNKLYINSDSTLNEFLSHVENSTSINYFDFDVIITDPNFYAYTNIPVDSDVSYLYDSNSSKNKTSEDKILLKSIPSSEKNDGKFAQIRINFNTIKTTTNNKLEFEIEFKARATIWQYFIINKSNINLSNSSIKGNIDIPFEGPSDVTIETGEKAIAFNSGNNLLTLSEVPKYKFNLIDTPSSNSKEARIHSKKIFLGLPNPSPENFKIFEENGIKKVLSPMYIYV